MLKLNCINKLIIKKTNVQLNNNQITFNTTIRDIENNKVRISSMDIKFNEDSF